MKQSAHPRYEFGSPVGDEERWFAWRPVRLWTGDVVWLVPVYRLRIAKHSYLDGPAWAFWSYRR